MDKEGTRINSYIVGCKCGTDYSADEHTPGINSYIVGCKLFDYNNLPKGLEN